MRRSGQKSTVASYVAVGLPKAGQRVATIDPDARQQSLTRYINNRPAWAAHTGLDLKVPAHFCIEQGRAMQIADNEELECLLSQLQLQLNSKLAAGPQVALGGSARSASRFNP